MNGIKSILKNSILYKNFIDVIANEEEFARKL